MRCCPKCKREKPLAEFYRTVKRSGKVFYDRCKECIAETRKKNYQSARRRKLCTRCYKKLPSDRSNLAFCLLCMKKSGTFGKARTRRLKLIVYAAYGGAFCDCCGEKNFEFLTLDHIYGGGGRHRRKVGAGVVFYKWLIDHNFPRGFRVLCMNCNWSFGKWGYCPHDKISRENPRTISFTEGSHAIQ